MKDTTRVQKNVLYFLARRGKHISQRNGHSQQECGESFFTQWFGMEKENDLNKRSLQ